MYGHLPSPLAAMLLALLVAPACADGQDQPEAPPADTSAAAAAPAPDTWQTRADPGHAAADGFSLTEAEATWRITTGQFSGILFRPEQAASGSYEVIAMVEVLPGSRKREGYGVFVGGTALDGADQRYTYVLLRDDGKYLIKTRDGAGTSTVVDWTASAAIRTLPTSPASDAVAANTMVLQVTATTITLSVNGERVLRRPRGDLPLDGIVGLRANHGLELRLRSLDVGAPAAPAE